MKASADNYLEINKENWNKRTEAHVESEFYDVPSFLKGKTSLNPPEIGLLGDLKGKSVLHLQCHFGLDTLSMQRMGASATGVDLSDKAIEQAREQFKSEYANLQTERQQYQQALGQLGAQLNAGIMKYQNVDWAKLKDEDPVAYVTKRDEFREEQERIQMVQHQMQQVNAQQQADAEKQHREAVVEQTAKLGQLIPEWNDPKQQPSLSKSIREYALAEGYEQEEVDGLIDARSVNVLLKAMRYDALQKADVKTKKVRNRPKMAKPGTKRAKSDAAKRRKAGLSKTLQDTGRPEDAAKLIEDLI